MKNKKYLGPLSRAVHQTFWPSGDVEDKFNTFSIQLKTFVFENLTCLKHFDGVEALRTWEYDSYNEEFFFKVRETLTVEIKSGVSRRSIVECEFRLSKSSIAELETAIELLNSEIDEWQKGLVEMRKLQLQRVFHAEGVAAYEAAVERGM